MHRTPSKVVIPNLSESFKKYANLCKLGQKIKLIYKINFSLLSSFSLLIYIYCGRGLKGRAGCRQTEVQTNKQTDRRSLPPTPKNWRTEMKQFCVKEAAEALHGVTKAIINNHALNT